jgi:hypothetical protein
MTVDVYGRWLPTGNRALIDQLDDDQAQAEEAKRASAAASGAAARGYKSATNPEPDETPASEVLESTGAIPPPEPFYVLNNLFASA